MKKTVIIKDNIQGNRTVKTTVNVPDKDHLQSQIKYPKVVFADKRKKKPKYKHKIFEEN